MKTDLQREDDRFLAMLGNVFSVFSVGYGVASVNLLTIFLALVLFKLSIRLAVEVASWPRE